MATRAQTAREALSAVPSMRLAVGFWQFKTFAAAVELSLFTRLSGGWAVTVRQAAADLDIHERAADVFLAACASLELLDKDGPHYFGGFVRFCDHEYRRGIGSSTPCAGAAR